MQWTSTEILDVVVQAGKRNTCLEDTVNSLNLLKPRIVRGIAVPNYPTSDTVFNRAKKVDTREWVNRYEEANRKLLESAVRARAFKGWVDLAIDIHDIPFYGKRNTRGIVGTKRKLGTNYAFRYMTVCVTAQKDKYTLSATPMTQLSSTPKTLEEMLEKALKYIDGHIGVTYVDRGFFSVPCIKTFEKLRLKYLMPVIKNTKIRKIIKENRDYPVVMPYTLGSRNKTVDMTLILIETVKEQGNDNLTWNIFIASVLKTSGANCNNIIAPSTTNKRNEYFSFNLRFLIPKNFTFSPILFLRFLIFSSLLYSPSSTSLIN